MQTQEDIRQFAVHEEDYVIPNDVDSGDEEIEMPDYNILVDRLVSNGNRERRQQ